MSGMATEDWETTCSIYESLPTHTVLDNAGNLLRGSIDLAIPLSNKVFCRMVSSKEFQYRFWTEQQQELVFRLDFWCKPDIQDANQDDHYTCYNKVVVSLRSSYPTSFPAKEEWLAWITNQAQSLLHQEPISFSVCMFVEQQVFDFFQCIYSDGVASLIQFDDIGRTFYDTTSLVVTGLESNQTKYNYSLFPMQRHLQNGGMETIRNESELKPGEAQQILPLLRCRKEWLPVECPICFDEVLPEQAATATCGHSFCRLCISTYFRHKAEELHSEYKKNPFICPITKCRKEIKIMKCVKHFLDNPLMEKVQRWYKDLKNPPCWSLPDCIKKTCTGAMRKEEVDGFMIFCDLCKGRWCELCLKRAPRDKVHTDCPQEVSIRFCERYLAAGDRAKERCETKWPWIKVYAKSRVSDMSVVQWIQSNGQICPGCKTGVERVEGCFHISCQCGTHFCYECGAQIFPPFYGTHHCWEEEREDEFFPIYN